MASASWELFGVGLPLSFVYRCYLHIVFLSSAALLVFITYMSHHQLFIPRVFCFSYTYTSDAAIVGQSDFESEQGLSFFVCLFNKLKRVMAYVK